MNRIVIADDSGTARMFTMRCLEVLGYQDVDTIECENGAEALQNLKDQSTDLLITDLTMPVMDGTALVKMVSEDDSLDVKRVIVVTSAGNPAKEEELAKYGASIISKPISPAKLAAVLSSEKPETWG